MSKLRVERYVVTTEEVVEGPYSLVCMIGVDLDAGEQHMQGIANAVNTLNAQGLETVSMFVRDSTDIYMLVRRKE